MRPVLDLVKENALNFYGDVTQRMREKGKVINRLRIRVVAYKDYLACDADGEMPMLTTDFFDLPAQGIEFRQCIESLRPKGGGDEPEDGLEALAYAMKTDWDTEGMKRRQIIVVWTDASTHAIGYGKSSPKYPSGMPQDFAELTEWWGDGQEIGIMNQSAKRLLLFAPDLPFWSTISDDWDNVIHFPSKAGKGLREVNYGQIIDTISNSI